MGKIVIFKALVHLKNLNLDEDGFFRFDTPQGAKILRVAQQFENDASVSFWYSCEPYGPMVEQKILVVGTGAPFKTENAGRHIGTEIFQGGALVLHFFLPPEGSSTNTSGTDNVDT